MDLRASIRAMQALRDGFVRGPEKSVIHTIPVPTGWSAEQAWEAISRGDELTDPEPTWANVEIANGKFRRLCD